MMEGAALERGVREALPPRMADDIGQLPLIVTSMSDESLNKSRIEVCFFCFVVVGRLTLLSQACAGRRSERRIT